MPTWVFVSLLVVLSGSAAADCNAIVGAENGTTSAARVPGANISNNEDSFVYFDGETNQYGLLWFSNRTGLGQIYEKRGSVVSSAFENEGGGVSWERSELQVTTSNSSAKFYPSVSKHERNGTHYWILTYFAIDTSPPNLPSIWTATRKTSSSVCTNWTEPQQVDLPDLLISYLPQTTVLSNGTVLLTWIGSNSTLEKDFRVYTGHLISGSNHDGNITTPPHVTHKHCLDCHSSPPRRFHYHDHKSDTPTAFEIKNSSSNSTSYVVVVLWSNQGSLWYSSYSSETSSATGPWSEPLNLTTADSPHFVNFYPKVVAHQDDPHDHQQGDLLLVWTTNRGVNHAGGINAVARLRERYHQDSTSLQLEIDSGSMCLLPPTTSPNPGFRPIYFGRLAFDSSKSSKLRGQVAAVLSWVEQQEDQPSGVHEIKSMGLRFL